MMIIICNRDQQSYFGKLLVSPDDKWEGIENIFVYSGDDLATVFSSREKEYDLILVEANLTWDESSLESFYGFDIVLELRRRYFVKAPIILCSSLPKSDFVKLRESSNKYGLLDAQGTGFISFPFTKEILFQQALEIEPLTDVSLRDVIIEYCGLQQEWRFIAHNLGNIISDNLNRNKELQEIVNNWATSINNFAPDQISNLENLQNLLKLSPDSVNITDLKLALEKLDDGLQTSHSTISDTSVPANDNQYPRCPPQGFSRVLIADDEPQPFLINSLRSQYGYDVVGQAYKLSQARDLLNKEKPDVVLSDYYFKESSRESELPDKSIGDKFIKYALTHPQYANTKPKKPIVLVTSKATLRAEADIRVGAINCSGANRATDPVYIHNVIWTEARNRGVTQPEEIQGCEWTLEYSCRQRLEQYKEDLPKIIKQWNEFKRTIHDTARLCHLLSQSTENDDPQIVQQAIGVLKPYESIEDFSLRAVADLFAEIEKVHDSARTPPVSEAKKAIRNILHGKIEQFSSVTNAVKFLINTLSSVARDLNSITEYQHLGYKLTDVLGRYSDSEPLLPTLRLLNETLLNLFKDLPEFPSSNISPRANPNVTGGHEINIVVVEDNDFWRDVVFSAIEKTKSRLGENFAIRYQSFDNAADALAAIPSTNQLFAIEGNDQNDGKTIAIVDICLPENREDAENIRAALERKIDQLNIPRSKHGLDLIRRLSDYEDNTPLIVFSTIDSIEDRKAIGAWGVADEDFLVKGIDDEEAIVRALIRKIEKRAKYVIEEFEDEGGNPSFRINGIPISFPKELNRSFSAIYKLCRTTGRNEFSIAEIIGAREDSATDKSKKVIQDQIYRIRNLILKTLRANSVYVDVRDLIKTVKSPDGEEFSYQLNAEVMSINDEGAYETDLEIYKNEVCKVLVIDNDPNIVSRVTTLLENSKYEVRSATNVADAVQAAEEFLPHIVSLELRIPYTQKEGKQRRPNKDEFGGVDAWRQIRMSLRSSTLGVVVLTADTDKNHLVAQAAQMEIPIRNIISKREEGWHNLFLKKVSDERRRVFLGEITDARQDINEPIVEILDGGDLQKGVLKLVVDGNPFKMKVSQLAKVIGLLLTNPKTLLSFESIKRGIGSDEPVTNSDPKNWPKRFKEIIRDQWLVDIPATNKKELAEKILESSSRGMRLNVQVIDSRHKQP